MNARLLRLWDALRASYWFIPTLMTLGAAAVSWVALAVDRAFPGAAAFAWLGGARGPEGARALLSTVAGSMISLAGVTFSILIVALALASSQFGPRLLRGFLRDTGNQIVLGTFIATFVYCLLVLRSVPSEADGGPLPVVSIALGFGFGLAGVAVLIYFIHHAAASIQASSVIEVAGHELDEAIRQTFPARGAEQEPGASSHALPEEFEDVARTIEAEAGGYVQEIDTQGLVAFAAEHDLVIQLLPGRGSFVLEGRPLARVRAPDGVDEEIAKVVREAVVLAAGRVSTRDVERGVSQLAEVAVRALSPGINDPFTAGNAIRRLGLSLALLGDRQLPTSAFHDDEGALRLLVPAPTIRELLNLAFDRIRFYGRADPHLPAELLQTLTMVGLRSRQPSLRRELLRHAELIRKTSVEALTAAADRERLEAAFETARAVLGVAQVGDEEAAEAVGG